MAKITAQIQWASNVDQLKASIREGTGSIVAMKDAVDRTARSLGGEGLLRAANNTTAAVSQLGSVTKLTTAEKERINIQLQKAIEKYTLLGQKAPQAMLDTEAATRKVEASGSKFSSWLGQANGLLATFGVGLSVGALVGFGRSLLNTADELVKVADRTGLTTTEVQRLKFIAEQSGNSIDQMTNAVSKLQNGLVREDGGVVATVKALGLNFDELRKASPFEQMEQIAAAIAKVPDPTARAAMAMALFGRAGAEILPSLIADFAGLGNAAPVMSDKTVRSLEQAGDTINLFMSTLKVWAAESFNFLSGLVDRLFLTGMKFKATVFGMIADLMEMAQKIPGASKVFEFLGMSVDSVRQKSQFYTDQARAQELQMNRVEVEVRKTAAAFVDFDPTVEKATGSVSKSERAAKAAADKWADWTESIRSASFAVQNFLSKTLMLAPSIEDNAASLGAYDLIAEHSVIVAGQQSEAARKYNEELGRMGVLLDFTAHASNNASQSLGEQQSVWASFGGFMKGQIGNLNQLFMSAFTGGGGALGAAKSFATQGAAALMGMIPVVGPFLSQFAGPIVAGFGKIGSAFKKAFGFGKSEGRQALEDANAEIKSLQDSLIRTYGPLDKIRLMGNGAGAALADAWGSQNRDGLAWLTQLAEQFTAEMNNGLTPAAETFGNTMSGAATGAVGDLLGLGAAAAVIKDGIATPIIIPVRFDVGDIDFPDSGSSKGGVSFKPPTQSDIDTFLRNNPGDEGRLRQAFTNITDEQANAAGIFSFATGTHGQFQDFGAGTPAMLHGRERVVTESEGRSDGGMVSALIGEMRALRAEQSAQRRALRDDLFLAVRDGTQRRRAA